jgi:CrcB protein
VSDGEPVPVPAAPALVARPAASTSQAAVLAAVAVGGVAGAFLRYGAALLWPTHPGGFPGTTLLVNLSGCAAMGVLMAVITTLPAVHPLARPFLGTGILGGYTTFSTYALDAHRLLAAGFPGTALAYLAATVAGALVAVTAGLLATRVALRAAPRVGRALTQGRRRNG